MPYVVLMKRLATFLICYTKALNVRGPRASPMHSAINTVLKLDFKSVIAQQTVGDSGFVQ